MTLATAVSTLAASDASKTQKADQYARAAANYEAASAARCETAEALLTLSREIRKKEHADERARDSNLRKAGHYERQAGELLNAACLGYDKAAGAWTKASREYKAAGDQPKAELMASGAALARESGTAACERSAEAYEYSAEAFSDINSGQMAVSAEEAARMREALARRLK
jgi:hypothetical protein